MTEGGWPAAHRLLTTFATVTIAVLIVLLCAMIIFLVIGLVMKLLSLATDVGTIENAREVALAYMGEILLVVIIIELIDTIVGYTRERTIRVGAVLLVAITAVARELIVFDYHEGDVLMLLGIGVAVMALAGSLLFVSKAVMPGHERKQTDDKV